MLAYHGQQAIKEDYLARVRAHAAADEITQGVYWQHGKGCAVGCTIHSNLHSDYESQLGIPRAIACLEDRIFEGLPNDEAKQFPEAFLMAIPVGADLSLVVAQFMAWLLDDAQDGVIRFARDDRGRAAIGTVATLYRRLLAGETITSQEWLDARSAAYDAAYTDDAADADAYDAAYVDAAAYVAYDAADACVDAADADTYTDAYTYAAAAYAAAAADAAGERFYGRMRDTLLRLLASSRAQS